MNASDDDVNRSRQQQSRFDKRGETFDLAVAVRVSRIRGAIGDANGKPRQDGSNQIEAGMQRFGKHAQAAGRRRQKHLKTEQNKRGPDRSQRRHLLCRTG